MGKQCGLKAGEFELNMLLALDAHYIEGGTGVSARVAGVGFQELGDREASQENVVEVSEPAPYVPGSFYLRELPGLLALIGSLDRPPELIFVDGYVWLPQGPGLGAHLWDALGRSVPVVGVAKSRYRDAPASLVYRRFSRRPLYVTSAGIPASQAAYAVIQMHGEGRLPDLLKRADRLARG